MDRRTLLRLGLGAGLTGAAALIGCAPPSAPPVNEEPVVPRAKKPITLTYWAWLKDLQKVCDIWNKDHPDVQVKAVWIQGGNNGGYQKLFSALAAGGGPDIAQVELRSVPQFMLVDGLVDLSRYGAEKYAHRYDPAIWRQVRVNDRVRAIPQDSGPLAFYYQPKLLEAVGAEPPTTWDEWAEIAAEIRKKDDNAYLESFNVDDASGFMAYAGQAGAAWFRPSGGEWVVDLTDDATLNVARFFDRAIDKDLLNTGFGAYTPGWTAAAGAGRICAVTGASWGDALIQTVGGGEGKWKVAPMQRWSFGGYGSTQVGGSTAAVMATTEHPLEAMEFAVWMTTTHTGVDAMIDHSGIGWSPARDYIGASREKPSAWFSGQRYNEEVFVPAAKQQNPKWEWGPITIQTLNALQDGFKKKLSAGRSLVDSVVEAERTVIATMRQMGLSVRAAR